jgi:hypothetical protein
LAMTIILLLHTGWLCWRRARGLTNISICFISFGYWCPSVVCRLGPCLFHHTFLHPEVFHVFI